MRVRPEYLRGAEYYAARRAIVRDGLHAQLFVKWYGRGLLVVEVQPLPGFAHLTRNWQECISAAQSCQAVFPMMCSMQCQGQPLQATTAS